MYNYRNPYYARNSRFGFFGAPFLGGLLGGLVGGALIARPFAYGGFGYGYGYGPYPVGPYGGFGYGAPFFY